MYGYNNRYSNSLTCYLHASAQLLWLVYGYAEQLLWLVFPDRLRSILAIGWYSILASLAMTDGTNANARMQLSLLLILLFLLFLIFLFTPTFSSPPNFSSTPSPPPPTNASVPPPPSPCFSPPLLL